MALLYKCKGRVILWSGDMAAWHFVHVDKRTSEIINAKHGAKKRGFGSVRVSVTIGGTRWNTSIFPDKQSGAYLLPLKASVRQKEGIAHGDDISFSLSI